MAFVLFITFIIYFIVAITIIVTTIIIAKKDDIYINKLSICLGIICLLISITSLVTAIINYN